MDLAERIRRGLKATLIARTIHVTATGALMVVLARYLLDPDEYGLLFLAISALSIVNLFASLGIEMSAARYLTEYRESDPSQVPHIITTSLKFRFIAIVVVTVTFFLFREPIAQLIGKEALVPLFGIGVFYIAFQSMNTFVSGLFTGFNRVDWSAVARGIGSLARLVLVLVFVGVVGGAIGALIGYVLSAALATVVGLAVLYFRFYRRYDRASEAEPGLSRRILRYSGPVAVNRSANVLDGRIDTVLIGYFLSPVAVSYYYLGKQIVDFLQTPAASLGYALSPTYGEQKAADRIDHASQIYQTSLEQTLLLYLPLGAGMVLMADPAIELVFGAGYLGAVPVVQLFSAYVVLQAVTFITSNGLDFLGRATSRAYTKGGTSIANFLLNLVAIPLFGVVGAAAATVATHSVYVALNLYIVHQEFSLDLARLGRSFGTICLITAGMAVIVQMLVPRISGLVGLFGVIALGGAVWAVLAVASGMLDLDRVVTVFS